MNQDKLSSTTPEVPKSIETIETEPSFINNRYAKMRGKIPSKSCFLIRLRIISACYLS